MVAGGRVTGPGRLPNFLIIGGRPRCGTTSLATWLAAHPDVHVVPEKEIHFFDKFFDRGVEWYRSRFGGASTETAVGEATPTYMLVDAWIARMRDVLPDAKLIAILREPVSATYSNYWFQRSLGHERRPFAAAVREEMRALEGLRIRYLSDSRYLVRLERVLTCYPRASLHVLLFEDLRDDPRGTFAAACRFIGVDDSLVPDLVGQPLNPATRLRSERLRRAMLRYRAWRRLPGWLTSALERANRTTKPYPPMEASLREELSAWFAEDNARLGEWLGRDLSSWGA